MNYAEILKLNQDAYKAHSESNDVLDAAEID